jgi:hypothetical protein
MCGDDRIGIGVRQGAYQDGMDVCVCVELMMFL